MLVTVDCLRNDVTYNKVFMPFTSNLKNESIDFCHYYSGGPITPYSFPSLMSGRNLYDAISIHGFVLSAYSLPAKIKNIDENFFTFRLNASNIWISDYMNYGKGFDLSLDLNSRYDKRRWKKSKTIFDKIKKRLSDYKRDLMLACGKERFLPYTSGLKLNNIFFNLYKDKLINRKFFGWIHYMDTHDPFFLYKKIIEKLNFNISAKDVFFSNRHYIYDVKRINKYLMLYNSSAAYVDSVLEQLLNFLDRKNILKDTIIIITADHGELLGEYNKVSHIPYFYNELINVPLIIYNPSILGNKKLDIAYGATYLHNLILRFSKNKYDILQNYNRKEYEYILSEAFFKKPTFDYKKNLLFIKYNNEKFGVTYAIIFNDRKYIFVDGKIIKVLNLNDEGINCGVDFLPETIKKVNNRILLQLKIKKFFK